MDDPLSEEEQSPAPCIVHRYPDRVLFYVSAVCAVYCRFCTRKRKVGDPSSVKPQDIEQGLDYIRQHAEIRDVVVSGGDPFMLSDRKIEHILAQLRAITHVELIRIGSRVPVTLPQRITPALCALLKKYHPLYVNTHFNHPREITPQSRKACSLLAGAGIVLSNQTVLLKGVNDHPKIMKRLMQKLLSIRVRPYYIYQADLVKGTKHFRTPVKAGLSVINSLRGHTSGLAVPHYVIDAPEGGGKIALAPNPVIYEDKHRLYLRNFENNIYSYPSRPQSREQAPRLHNPVEELAEEVRGLRRERIYLRENLANLAQTASVLIYMLDASGNFSFLNQAVEEMLGYKPEELIGRHFSTIIPGKEYQKVSRGMVLPELKGTSTGLLHAPKLFDERRTGARKTRNLALRLITKSGKELRVILGESAGLITKLAGEENAPWREPESKHRILEGSRGVVYNLLKSSN